MLRVYSIILFICLFMVSCKLETSKNINADKVNKEIKERKIKRLLPAEISNAAFEKGQLIAESYLASMNKPVSCEDSLIVLPDSLQKFVSHVELICEAPTNSKLNEVWKAYQFQVAQDSSAMLNDNLQENTEESGFWYSKPIQGQESLILLNILIDKREVVLSL